MSTRGAIAFIIDGEEKITYNHSDSYPECLGVAMLNWARRHRHALTCDLHRGQSGGPVDLARKLRVVDPNSTPSAEDIARLRPQADLNVGERKITDWYCLLRNTQGDPDEILKAGVIENGAPFVADSLYCEWAYAIDLDGRTFEVFRGFQKRPHSAGRWADRQSIDGSRGYHAVALIASWPLDKLPSEADFLAELAKADQD